MRPAIPSKSNGAFEGLLFPSCTLRRGAASGQGADEQQKRLLSEPQLWYTVQIIKQTAALRAAVCSCFQKYGIFRAERSWQIFEIIDRLFALPINLFTILRIMPLINSHPLDLFRVSACRLDDNGGFLAYAPSPLLDIFAIFATINWGDCYAFQGWNERLSDFCAGKAPSFSFRNWSNHFHLAFPMAIRN